MPNYHKSKLCVAFSSTGTCSSVAECRFAHGALELRRPFVPKKGRGQVSAQHQLMQNAPPKQPQQQHHQQDQPRQQRQRQQLRFEQQQQQQQQELPQQQKQQQFRQRQQHAPQQWQQQPSQQQEDHQGQQRHQQKQPSWFDDLAASKELQSLLPQFGQRTQPPQQAWEHLAQVRPLAAEPRQSQLPRTPQCEPWSTEVMTPLSMDRSRGGGSVVPNGDLPCSIIMATPPSSWICTGPEHAVLSRRPGDTECSRQSTQEAQMPVDVVIRNTFVALVPLPVPSRRMRSISLPSLLNAQGEGHIQQ